MSRPVTREELIEVLESILLSQVRALRLLRRERSAKARPGSRTAKKSNMSLIEDILKDAGAPMHINEIILRATRDHGVTLKRESIVSALTKRILDGRTFRRTGRNVFALRTEEAG